MKEPLPMDGSQHVLPAFVELEYPDYRPIILLHRGNDGFVPFCRKRKDSDDFEDMFSMKASEIESYFPQLLPALDVDSYFGINAMYRANKGTSLTAKEHGVRLPQAYKSGDGVKYLTAVFADIDCHKLGIDVGSAVGAVIRAQDRGDIPPASMLTRSGRGVWVWWMLRDEKNPRLPIRAWPEVIRLWCNVQRKVTDLFASVGADAGARDSARITRVPGSVNSKADARVVYWLQAGSDGKPFSYTLEALANTFNVELPTRNKEVMTVTKRLSVRGRKGQRGRWLRARTNFENLWERRGRFAEGVRNNAVFVYATILRSQLLDESVVWEECRRLYADLDQGNEPYTLDDLAASMKRAVGFGRVGRFGGVRNQTIADMLDVTPDESVLLPSWKPASRFKTTPEPESLSRRELQVRRRELLRVKVAELGFVPSQRELVGWLEEQGVPTVEATVAKDLDALGIDRPKPKPKKRRKRAHDSQRKLL